MNGEQERPSAEELREGYESHDLRVSLNKMSKAADLPDNIEFVVAPTKQFAVLLTALCAGRVHVVVAVEDESAFEEQYVEYAPDGDYFASYTPGDLPDENTVDLRLHTDTE